MRLPAARSSLSSFVFVALVAVGSAGCLAQTAEGDANEAEITRPIPVGPAVERPEPSAAGSRRSHIRLDPAAMPIAHETQNAAVLGSASPTPAQ